MCEASDRYDYIIVGSGLYGCTFAHRAHRAGKRCLVLERRAAAGGNVRCERVEGINVHAYGAHIFHTANRRVWDYVTGLVEMNRYTNSPIANYHGRIYNLPFNMNTFHALWGVTTPLEAQAKLQEQRGAAQERLRGREPANLEEQALTLVGEDIYRALIEGYTEKQWGRPCRELPAFIIRRLPVRLTYDNNYFNDPWQGIPERGYNLLIARLLEGVEVRCGVDYLADRAAWRGKADKVLFTGALDEWFDHRLGRLPWRTVRFETEVLNCQNYQGVAVVNYTDRETPYTRVIEHKHFEFGQQPRTVISREYSCEWQPGMEPYYPVNDQAGEALANQYKRLAAAEKGVLFGGRLADYKYYNMDQVIAAALALADNELQAQ